MATEPSFDEWLKIAKADPQAAQCGMYLCHNGVARITPKAQVRGGEEGLPAVKCINFGYDAPGVEEAIAQAKKMDGIYYVRMWLAEGEVQVGESIMYVLVGGDIRPHVIDCLQALVGKVKTDLVTEQEVYA